MTPGVAGGFNSTSVLLIIAIVGTTVAPWQLFFQQSNIVDKRITPRWINYERVDTVLGSFITVLAASLIIITTAFAFAHTRAGGTFHQCRRRGPRARPLSRQRHRHALRHHPAERFDHRGRRGDAVDVVRLR